LSKASGNAIIVHPQANGALKRQDRVNYFAAALNDSRFIIHLIATRDQVPQHRHKRKAAPDQGAAAYRLSGAIDIPAEPNLVRRSI
jgi:hypothetical protein